MKTRVHIVPRKIRSFKGLAVALMVAAAAPAMAAGLHVGVGASVGGIGAHSNTNVGSGGINSNTSVSAGGVANAHVGVSANQSNGVNANATVGTPAADANVSASINNGADANVGISVPGTAPTLGAPPSTTQPPGATLPGTGVPVSKVTAEINAMSNSDRIVLKKRCVVILGASSEYDTQLVALCRLLART